MMGPIVYLFVWLTAVGEGSIDSFSRDDFIFYYIALILINQLTYASSNWTTGEAIRNGTISVWLLRPLPPIYEAIASDLAVKIVCMPFVIIVSLVMGIVFNLKITFEWNTLLIFLFTLIMSIVLRFLLTYIIAILAFWTNRIDALLLLINTFIFLFAGQVAPTVLLPKFMQKIANLLPFRYTLGFSVELLMGKLYHNQIYLGLLCQLVWVILLFIVYRVIWRRAIKSYTAIGG